MQINEIAYRHGKYLPVELMPLETIIGFDGQAERNQDMLTEDLLLFVLSALISTHLEPETTLRILNSGLPLVQLSELKIKHPKLASCEGYYMCNLLYFSDNEEYSWYGAINETNKLSPMCP